MIQLLNRMALGFASAGIAIAASLTVSHASNIPLPCGGGSGCETVAQDPSSSIFGIPVSAFGLAAYIALAILAGLRIWAHRPQKADDAFATPATFAPLREKSLFQATDAEGADVQPKADSQHMLSGRLNIFAGTALSTIGTLASIGLTYYSVTHIHATCAWCIGSGAMMLGSMTTYLLLLKIPDELSTKRRPLTALPWLLVPALVIGAIAILGGRTKPAAPDLSSVRLDLVSFNEVLKSSHVLGSPSAPITIAEFGDLMCPACRDMHERVLRFQGKYPTKVSILFHHFPLASEAGHELSIPAAEMSDRLTDSDFWSFVNQVYASETKPTQQDLDAIFASLGKPIKTQTEAKQALAKEIALGQKYGIHQTPTYILFVNQTPISVATSTNLAQAISKPAFAKIIRSAP